jgi:hypothetical protein
LNTAISCQRDKKIVYRYFHLRNPIVRANLFTDELGGEFCGEERNIKYGHPIVVVVRGEVQVVC